MVTVGYERLGADLPSYPHPISRHQLIAKRANESGGNHPRDVINQAWFEEALTEATTTVKRFPEANLNIEKVAMLYAFSTDNAGVQLSISSGQDSQPAEQENG